MTVVLVHGLWVPGALMHPLAARLAALGHRCRTFSYLGAVRPLHVHAERLARFARELAAEEGRDGKGGAAHFVGHSMGGLVILDALQAHPDLAVGKVVLLGSPVRGCFAGRRLARHPAGRWFLGQSEALWREDALRHWRRPEPLGVLAGSLPLGLGRLFGALPGTNDGVVSLEETDVDGMRERVVVPVGHSQMLLSARVAAQVDAFLRHGAFLR